MFYNTIGTALKLSNVQQHHTMFEQIRPKHGHFRCKQSPSMVLFTRYIIDFLTSQLKIRCLRNNSHNMFEESLSRAFQRYITLSIWTRNGKVMNFPRIRLELDLISQKPWKNTSFREIYPNLRQGYFESPGKMQFNRPISQKGFWNSYLHHFSLSRLSVDQCHKNP